MPPPNSLPDPWYYLPNFEFALDWIGQRYADLLQHHERAFIDEFGRMPRPAKALLVRMIMRKGDLFRLSKLRCVEIGDTQEAVQDIMANGWVDAAPLIDIQELCSLLTKKEVALLFGAELERAGLLSSTKATQLAHLQTQHVDAQTSPDWLAGGADAPLDCAALATDCIYKVNVGPLCERFRLMFFGNLRQDWTEFVLADLGMFRYEPVPFPLSSRAFQTSLEVDDYTHLHRCKEQLEQHSGRDDLAGILQAVPSNPYDNAWLETRRAKLLFQIGRHLERHEAWNEALDCYERSIAPGARARRVRVLDRAGHHEAAWKLAVDIAAAPAHEAEAQCIQRMMPRLRRRCGHAAAQRSVGAPLARDDLTLPAPAIAERVESEVLRHLWQPDAPAYYVENTLINSLFGLLCWDAIFAAIPGAFFHPFQQGPADLARSDFTLRRQAAFDTALAKLSSQRYIDAISTNFYAKQGIQSPFVAWHVMTPELLQQALHCIPATHLEAIFRRLLLDVHGNRSGLPDLIQFWPDERRYRMVEVKGPGDRLQDNQIRWLEFCHARNIPVSVCYVKRELAA
jgi:hypothetical protein